MPQELPGGRKEKERKREREREMDAKGTISFTKILITETNKIRWSL